jgi:pyruvate dehydrogenase E2 component (dihydrolipoamide acetyltransferase)
MELVARGDGILRKRLVGEGESRPVGQLVGVIAPADENIDALVGSAGAAAPAAAPAAPAAAPAGAPTSGGPPPKSEATPAAPPTRHPSDAASTPRTPAAAAPTPAPAPSGDGGRLRSSPLARRLASERGIDIGGVPGSGPGGRIIRRDIEAAVAAGPAAAAPRPAQPAVAGADYRDVPLTQMRKTIARRLVESIGPIPTFYLTGEIDMERVSEMRSAMAQMGDEFKVSFNDIVLKAVAVALSHHPECNAHWLGDHIRQFNRVHLGMAVAVDEGLITPIIFDADRKSLREISAEARELAKRARERKLKPEEYTGATFSVSNLGMFGVIEQFTAIINPPEVGILAIGAVAPKAVPTGASGELTVRRRMRITMSCDHRVIDGATGARFLQTLQRKLENPLILVY